MANKNMNMRSLIYISTFYPPEEQEYLLSAMSSAANISASAFSYALLSGLAVNKNKNLYVINVPLTGPFPNRYKRFLTKGSVTKEFGVDVRNIPVFNLYGIQGSSITNHVRSSMESLNEGNADIIVYSLQRPLLKAAVDYKRSHKDCRIILVIPDFFEEFSKTHSIIKFIKKKLFGDISELIQAVDAYVLLTPLMLERLNNNKPYCIVEGIYNPTENRKGETIDEKETERHFNILYTGMLYEKYGVRNLVDAVHSLNIVDINLKLCGSGDLVEYIKNISLKDNRIQYLGIVPRDKVLKLQTKASLLVNPRQPNGGFTRYSFPSKNIEYLASNVPMLMYELEGIPEEYYKYCYHLSSNQLSIESLASKIREIYNTPKEDRIEIANKAYDFVTSQKNSIVQTQKILDLIDTLYE